MRHTLTLHPDSHCDALTGIEAEGERLDSRHVLLRYFLYGEMSALRFPPRSQIRRGEKLWKHCCFEGFLRIGQSQTYYELNFAPSYEWAAYTFDSYRQGMRDENEIAIQYVVTVSNEKDHELRVSYDIGRLPELSCDAELHLGLSAVIEETNGNKSYWALAHPPGAPDFHHKDCFALKLPPQKSA